MRTPDPTLMAGLSALLASALLAFPVRRLILRLGVIDRPNERSSHRVPTPRGGGLAIVLGIVLAVPWFVPEWRALAPAAFGLAAIVAISLVDDFASLSSATRFVVQVAAAVVAVVGLGLPVSAVDLPTVAVTLPSWAGLALAVLFVVAYCNFFNFMDGINGLAAVQATLTAATLAVLLRQGGQTTWAVVAAAVCGASAGFLPHNFPAARMFMGDVGSVTLGFLLALLSQVAHARAGVPWTALLLVHGAFLFDAVTTVIKRALRGENVVRPHREHIYQLLVRGGWSHPLTTSTYAALSAGCCAAGYLYARTGAEGRWVALVVPAVGLTILSLAAHRRPPAPAVAPVAPGAEGGR